MQNKHQLFIFLILFALCAANLFFSERANAVDIGQLCISGKILIVRKRCHSNEKIVKLSTIQAAKNCASGVKGEAGLQGPLGVEGATGAPGPDGPMGEVGKLGTLYGEPLQSGLTAFGVIAGDIEDETGSTHSIYSSLLAVLPQTLSSNDIVIQTPSESLDGCISGDPCIANDQRDAAHQERCEGNAENPLPTPGTLCVYPTYLLNVEALTPGSSQNKFGLIISFRQGAASKFSSFSGVWAYKAP